MTYPAGNGTESAYGDLVPALGDPAEQPRRGRVVRRWILIVLAVILYLLGCVLLLRTWGNDYERIDQTPTTEVDE